MVSSQERQSLAWGHLSGDSTSKSYIIHIANITVALTAAILTPVTMHSTNFGEGLWVRTGFWVASSKPVNLIESLGKVNRQVQRISCSMPL